MLLKGYYLVVLGLLNNVCALHYQYKFHLYPKKTIYMSGWGFFPGQISHFYYAFS